jgi:3-oxoacyl-[acyl-carrier protein] reductase
MSWNDDTTVIVTGSGQGIGRGIAAEFARRGAHVVVVERDPALAEESVKFIADLGGSASFVVCDVSSSTSVDEMTQAVIEKRGRIDVLVNNAGISRPAMLWDLTDEQWHAVLNTNLSSQFFTIRAVVRAWMKENGGAIVNISSLAGLRGSIGQINYAAAKSGVIGVTKAAALELARYGVRVNGVAPGLTLTPMTQKIMDTPKLHDRYVGEIPLGRIGEPEDIARAVAFLASEDAGWITGKILTVDGGAYN